VDIPEGFEPYTASASASTFGPVFESRSGAVPALGVRATDQHANSTSRVHGGPLVALADTALGDFVKSIVTGPTLAETVDMDVSFMAGARIGQWIEVHPSLDRSGQSLIFDSGEIRADESMTRKVSAKIFIHYHSHTDREEST